MNQGNDNLNQNNFNTQSNDDKSDNELLENNETANSTFNQAQSKSDFYQIADNVTRMANYKMHAQNLYIPVLNDFNIADDGNPQTILLASGHGFVEQLTSDGYVEEGKFEERIEIVINSTKQFMKNNGCENADNSFIFYKDYYNGVFNFKIYVCDMIISVGNEKKAIRQFIAYFVENNMHDFYQMSLSAGPFTMPTQMLKIGFIDLENDQITMSLDDLMTNILDNLKYRK